MDKDIPTPTLIFVYDTELTLPPHVYAFFGTDLQAGKRAEEKPNVIYFYATLAPME